MGSRIISLGKGGYIKLKPSANAWWNNHAKVYRLLISLEFGNNIKDSCEYAEITNIQYKYFVQNHPDFKRLLKFYKNNLVKEAENTVKTRVTKDKSFALRYLRKTKPEEFPEPFLKRENEQLRKQLGEQKDSFDKEMMTLKKIVGLFQGATSSGPEPEVYLANARHFLNEYNRDRTKKRITKPPKKTLTNIEYYDPELDNRE